MRKIIQRLLAIVLSIVVVLSSAPIYASAATQKSSYPDEKTSLTESLQKQLEEGTIGNSKESKSKLKTYDPEQFVTIIVELKNQKLVQDVYSKYNTFNTSVSHESVKEKIRQLIQQESSGQAVSAFSINKSTASEPVLSTVYDYYKIMNGFSIKVKYKYLNDIKKIIGVQNAFVEHSYEIPESEETTSGSYLNGDSMSMISAGADGYTGKGTVIAIIDSGLDTDHEAFSGAMDKGSLALTESEIDGLRSTLHGSDGAYLSDKIPFAYDYGDKDNDPDPGNNESLTHGTHVAGIIGANGGDVIRGVSPDAQIVPMKVADDALGLMYDSDIIAAIEDAVTLGVDAINMSLGSDAGFPEDSNTTYANVYNSVKNANIILNVAAGNAYDAANNNLSGQSLPYVTDPDSSIIASPSTYGASLSVASVNALSAIKYFITSDGEKIEYAPSDAQAPSLGSLNGSIELVDCGYGHVDEIPDTVSGKIALIKRGSNIPGEQFYYSTKVDNVNNKGAVAAVVYNNMSSNDGLLTMTVTNTSIPSVFISYESGTKLLAISDKTITVSDDYSEQGTKMTMSDFSSLGVSPNLDLKPEITAPGGNIYSSIIENKYDYMSGTSMATPAMAGLSGAVIQYVREKKPNATKQEIYNISKALLMSTATPIPDGEDSYYTPRKQGAGLANLKKAIESSAYITVDGQDDSLPKANLGDSINGAYTFTFTVHNMSDKALSYTMDTAALSEKIKDGFFQLYSENYAGRGITITYDGLVDNMVNVPANSDTKITVHITAEEAFKNAVTEAVNGTFIDGFVMLKSNVQDIDLSVPFLGFYGDWSKAPIFDATMENNNAHMLGSYAYCERSGYLLGTNALKGDGVVHYDRFTVAPNGIAGIYGTLNTQTGLLRNAATLTYTVTPKDDPANIVKKMEYEDVSKSYYMASYGAVSYAEAFLDEAPYFDGYDQNNNGVPDGWYTYTATAWAEDGDDEPDDIYTFDFYYDTTSPVIESYQIIGEEGDQIIEIVASDENYISAVELADSVGGSLGRKLAGEEKSSYEENGRQYYTFDFDYEDAIMKLGWD